MRPAILGAGLIIFTSCVAFGQGAAESPTFEVASIKPAPPPTGMGIRVMMRGGPGTPDPGQLTYSNVSLKNVLMNAYAVKGYQINGPKWLDSERFDIVAKIPKGATKEQFQVPPPPGSDGAGPMMNRVKIGADGMPQLPPGMGKGGMMMMMMNGRMRVVGNGQPVSALTEMLGNQLGRPVVDATELKAKYDLTLDFAPESMNGPMGMMPPPPPQHDGGPGPGGPMAGGPDAGGPSIFTALQEQLGLKLEQRKGPVDLLVIDRLEKVPIEN